MNGSDGSLCMHAKSAKCDAMWQFDARAQHSNQVHQADDDQGVGGAPERMSARAVGLCDLIINLIHFIIFKAYF